MNYCHIHEKLNMPEWEVENYLLNSPGEWLDLDTNKWYAADAAPMSCINIKYNTESIIPNPREDYEEYTNQLTSISWIELREYLLTNPEIIDIFHSAFILDLAKRNCITLSEELLRRIRNYRPSEPVVSFIAARRMKDIKTLMSKKNEIVWEELSLLTMRDAFMRV